MSEKTDQILRELGYVPEKEATMSDENKDLNFEEVLLQVEKVKDKKQVVRKIIERISSEAGGTLDNRAVDIAKEEVKKSKDAK